MTSELATPSQRREQFLAKIHGIAVDTSPYQDEVAALLQLGRHEFGTAMAAITVADGDALKILDTAGDGPLASGAVVKVCDAFCGIVIERGEPLLISDAGNSEWRDHPGHTVLGLHAYLGAPILVKGGMSGSVCLLAWEPREEAFTALDQDLLVLWARRIESVLERLEVTQALRASEALFRTTFEHANIGIAHVALDGSFINVNPRLCETLGYAEQELLARTFQDVTYPDDLDANVALRARVFAGETDHYSIRKRYIRKDGQIIWVHLTARLLRDTHGEPVHFISVLQDLTEQMRDENARLAFEQRVQEAQKLESLGVLAGGIAHDFNNLLTAEAV